MTKDRRVQIRFTEAMEADVYWLAEQWKGMGDPLTPSEVVREAVRQAVETEKARIKPKEKRR